MEMGFRAPPCVVTGRRRCRWLRRESERADRVGETALRRVGDYRCRQRGAYCTPRIHASRGLVPLGGWSLSWAERWSGWLARLAGGGRLKLRSVRPRGDSDVPDRAPRTLGELEVRRVYEPNRLAAMYLSTAYAHVVPCRRRITRSAVASEVASVSRVVDDRRQMVDGAAPRAS